jgi:hypothetical protein
VVGRASRRGDGECVELCKQALDLSDPWSEPWIVERLVMSERERGGA